MPSSAPTGHRRSLPPEGRRTRRTRLAVLVGLAVVASACGSAREAPPLAIPTNAEPSVILDAQGRPITVLRDEDRTNVPLEQIPAVLQNAVVAIEDSRFWSHDGIDPRGIARAASSNAAAGEVSQGGSTITQQYVKTALLTPERTLSRKVEEATLAVALERNYSKQLILELYLNTIYFGDGSYGIDAAARNYFGVPARDLSLDQAALLAGIIRAPSRYDPRQNPEAAVERRNVVLARMQELGYLTADQQLAAAATPLVVAEPQPEPEQLPYPAAHFVDEVKDWLLKRSDVLGTTQAERFDNLVRGGLRITTTVDLDLQARAEEAVAAVLRNQGRDPRTPDAGLVALDPRTGHVVAMVGGYDYFGSHEYRQTNLARGAGRQTGSAFKPIVLATALANGVPADRVFDAPSTEVHRLPDGGGTWTVSGGGIGAGTMGQCTVVSSNTCYANIILDPAVGPERSVEMAERLGVTSSLQANPAAVLGTNDATVLDMAAVYGTFANGGVAVPPVFVTRIERSDGTVLYEHQHAQTKVLEPEVARQVSEILPGVITSGTGTAAAIDRPAAGKTGSSQNNVDAWFVGYTPELSTAVWVGFAQPRPDRSGRLQPVAMNPPATRITVYGGTYPAQIWSTFMRRALQGRPALPLVDPAAVPTPTTTVPPSDERQLQPLGRPGTATMPEVTGLDRRTAVARVRSAGLEPREVEGPAGAAAGRIAAQSPPPGTALRAGSTVVLEYSPGLLVPDAAVPDLRGFGAGQARSTLEELGFTVSTENVSPPPGALRPDGSPYVAGQVWRSVPAAGERSTDGRVVVTVMPLETSTGGSPTTTTPPSTTVPRD